MHKERKNNKNGTSGSNLSKTRRHDITEKVALLHISKEKVDSEVRSTVSSTLASPE